MINVQITINCALKTADIIKMLFRNKYYGNIIYKVLRIITYGF